jgi:hypothetical protein
MAQQVLGCGVLRFAGIHVRHLLLVWRGCDGVPVVLAGTVDTLSFDTQVANNAPTAITAATAAVPNTTPGRRYTGNGASGAS